MRLRISDNIRKLTVSSNESWDMSLPQEVDIDVSLSPYRLNKLYFFFFFTIVWVISIRSSFPKPFFPIHTCTPKVSNQNLCFDLTSWYTLTRYPANIVRFTDEPNVKRCIILCLVFISKTKSVLRRSDRHTCNTHHVWPPDGAVCVIRSNLYRSGKILSCQGFIEPTIIVYAYFKC